MAKDRSDPLSRVTFRCKVCQCNFEAEPERVEACPELEHHPFAYFGRCPHCGAEAETAHWYLNLIKGWSKATGPTTPEGVAATSANLVGHPTPEESKRTRFNAMKHGLSARTATYFPSKPDGYDFCRGCDVDRGYCAEQPACVKKTELFMLHHAAFDQRNPKHLMGIYADLQASIFAVLQQILQTIVADGVKITTPEWYTDKETGKTVIAEYKDEQGNRRILTEINAHPLFKPLGDLLSKTGLTLSDMGMTTKVIEAESEEMGQLSAARADKDSLLDFGRRQTEALEKLHGVIERARLEKGRDAVLIEYQENNGG
ncbi:MAG: hypothetical protein KJ958_10585 [Gammaproteobacteria bacterium]|nr:hypothetical protein [Gammaproteobacteria bacterium]MBU1979601.1 hypothetical protein [Gammaproteobacteria bacterium]